MLHVIADLKSELAAFIFAGVQRSDVRLLHHPARVHGAWHRGTRAIECALPQRRLDWHYPAELIRQLDAIRPGDAVLIFSIINQKNLLLLHKYLRTKQARVQAFLWNPVQEHGADPAKAARRLQAVRAVADRLFTFDAADAATHQMAWVPQPYRCLSPALVAQSKDGGGSEWDFCFIGMDKGRLPFLQHFRQQAERLGLRCFFHILPDKGRRYSAQEQLLLGRGYLSYAENLAHAARARCLLEVVQASQSGSTIRSVEALFLHRKLVTTRQAARHEAGFDARRTLVLDDPIDPAALQAFMQTPLGAPDAASMRQHEINHWLDDFV